MDDYLIILITEILTIGQKKNHFEMTKGKCGGLSGTHGCAYKNCGMQKTICKNAKIIPVENLINREKKLNRILWQNQL